MNLKIQMLAGKEAKTYFERFFKNLQPLVQNHTNGCRLKQECPVNRHISQYQKLF